MVRDGSGWFGMVRDGAGRACLLRLTAIMLLPGVGQKRTSPTLASAVCAPPSASDQTAAQLEGAHPGGGEGASAGTVLGAVLRNPILGAIQWGTVLGATLEGSAEVQFRPSARMQKLRVDC